jgi:hypothetical protein
MLYKMIQKLDDVFRFAQVFAYCRSVEPENNECSK